ncbi:hypothetical protein K474DRAFT_1604536 [Panus rudis PR-1116 ss-1]|nr:hypothetical protein K474DRAFT_1604536 [Panus rudis PR-1116 ss-1]
MAVEEATTPYTVEVYDLWGCARSCTIERLDSSNTPAVDFARHGYLTKTALSPSVAISFRTLELYHNIRCCKASFSAEAFGRLLCKYYKIPYRRHMRTIVADTYEVYLNILREVEKRVHSALGWDDPDWRALNACRACCYELEDEPSMRFSRLWVLDGNDSLKRAVTLSDREAADTRVYTDSDYFLPREFVDKYANEVKSRQVKGPQIIPDVESEDEDTPEVEPLHEVEGDPMDGSPDNKGVEQCVRNWKAAALDDKKKAWGIFDETGIFASACRHSQILWVADMVQSGELAKYPLSMVAKGNQTLKRRSLIGYDIGCSFEKTVRNSSLGGDFLAGRHMFCVNAFHGYTHSYDCQVKHHPNVTTGIGLEDLETLERIFSASNNLASITRYASPYRRRQMIHFYFRQWDEEKYLNTGSFILNNYVQALAVLETDRDALATLKEKLQLSDDDLCSLEKEEQEFFATLGKERPWDTYAIAYVELLQRLQQLDSDRSLSTSRFYDSVPSTYSFVTPSTTISSNSYSAEALATARLEQKRRKAMEEYDRVHNEVLNLEIRMNISESERWTPASPQYKETLKYLEERQYQRALMKVQKLVIQRLFELHKLNLAQTGYKLRTHLAKSLQARCKAIRNAVAQYNAAAAKLSPPRPPLDWSQVSHYGFLDEFVLLQDTRNDIRDRPWANTFVREAIKLRRRIARAEEEVVRCNVETRRLHTAIFDEAALFKAVLEELDGQSSPLHGPVKDFVMQRMRINERLLSKISQIYALSGFSGCKGPGVRLGNRPLPRVSSDPSYLLDLSTADPPVSPAIPTSSEDPSPANAEDNDDDDDDNDEVDDDDGDGYDIGRFVQFVATLS